MLQETTDIITSYSGRSKKMFFFFFLIQENRTHHGALRNILRRQSISLVPTWSSVLDPTWATSLSTISSSSVTTTKTTRGVCVIVHCRTAIIKPGYILKLPTGSRRKKNLCTSERPQMSMEWTAISFLIIPLISQVKICVLHG